MSFEPCSTPLPPSASHGLALFNAGEYFEAHEALEYAWKHENGAVRELYQGILQVAVTYLHIQRKNYDGALKVFERARLKLDGWPDRCCGVDVAALREDLAVVIAALTRLGPEHIQDFDQSLFKPLKIF
jgi:uncharacterized protein